MQRASIRTNSKSENAKLPIADDLKPKIENCRPLVKQIALQVASSIPRHVELDELISAGMVGLVEAAKRFDPTRGVKFEAFVAERVRGAIIDFLRSLDWVPRSVRSAGKRAEEERSRLTAELRRQPTDAELAAELEMSVNAYRHIQDSLTGAVVLTLDRSISEDGEDTDSIMAAIADTDAPQPSEILEHTELCGYLIDAINCLPHQTRTVIGLYYIEGMHMAEIGQLLGVTQSRASQIHSAALTLLKDAILTQLDPQRAPDLSQPKGRKAKRMANFFTEVADASKWQERLDDTRRSIKLDFAPILSSLEKSCDMTADEFEHQIAEEKTETTPEMHRWAIIVQKSAEIRRRTAQKRQQRLQDNEF